MLQNIRWLRKVNFTVKILAARSRGLPYFLRNQFAKSLVNLNVAEQKLFRFQSVLPIYYKVYESLRVVPLIHLLIDLFLISLVVNHLLFEIVFLSFLQSLCVLLTSAHFESLSASID